MLARAALSGLISIVALSVAPAHSQPSGAGSSGLLSPAPLTGSGPARRFIPPDRSVAAPSSTATLPQEVEQDPAPPLQEQTAAPSASTPPTPGPLWTRREIAPAATRTTPKQPPRHRRTASAPQPRREAVKEASTQKRQGPPRSQVRPNRLGAATACKEPWSGEYLGSNRPAGPHAKHAGPHQREWSLRRVESLNCLLD